MASKRDEILAKIKGSSLSELKAQAPAETSKMKRKRVWSKVKKVADTLDINLGGTSTSRGSGHPHHGGHGGHHQPSPASFREEHRFDPERAYWERAQERAYFSMIDGKGDPQPHDHDHEH